MPHLPLEPSQRAQLIAWTNREKDHVLSIEAISSRLVLTRATGTHSLISNDLEFLYRLRTALRSTPTDLSRDDLETLTEVASSNLLADKADFWDSIIRSIKFLDDPHQLPLFP